MTAREAPAEATAGITCMPGAFPDTSISGGSILKVCTRAKSQRYKYLAPWLCFIGKRIQYGPINEAETFETLPHGIRKKGCAIILREYHRRHPMETTLSVVGGLLTLSPAGGA